MYANFAARAEMGANLFRLLADGLHVAAGLPDEIVELLLHRTC